jgi:hypothetical protein
MFFPVLILGLVISILIAAVAFLLHPSGSYRRLGLMLLASCIGFFVGQITCELIAFRPWMIGAVNMVGGVTGSVLGLAGLQIFGLREWG